MTPCLNCGRAVHGIGDGWYALKRETEDAPRQMFCDQCYDRGICRLCAGCSAAYWVEKLDRNSMCIDCQLEGRN